MRIGVYSASFLFATAIKQVVLEALKHGGFGEGHPVDARLIGVHYAQSLAVDLCGIADNGDELLIVELRAWADELAMSEGNRYVRSDGEAAQRILHEVSAIKLPRRRKTHVIGLVEKGEAPTWWHWLKGEKFSHVKIIEIGDCTDLMNKLPGAIRAGGKCLGQVGVREEAGS